MNETLGFHPKLAETIFLHPCCAFVKHFDLYLNLKQKSNWGIWFLTISSLQCIHPLLHPKTILQLYYWGKYEKEMQQPFTVIWIWNCISNKPSFLADIPSQCQTSKNEKKKLQLKCCFSPSSCLLCAFHTAWKIRQDQAISSPDSHVLGQGCSTPGPQARSSPWHCVIWLSGLPTSLWGVQQGMTLCTRLGTQSGMGPDPGVCWAAVAQGLRAWP